MRTFHSKPMNDADASLLDLSHTTMPSSQVTESPLPGIFGGVPGATLSWVVGLGLWLSGLGPAAARIPEPDAVLHGRIVVDGQGITAGRTDVVVVARRLADGLVLAGYRMGSEPAVGDRYVLRIPLESGTPPTPPLAAAVGETVQVEFRSAVQVLDQRAYTLIERGQIQRLDLTVGGGGGGDNGLPDDWEIFHFGAAGQDPDGDADGDGRTNREEYEAGTDPRQADDVLVLGAEGLSGNIRLSFVAQRAAGVGYPAGVSRRFLLETSESPAGPWLPAAGFAEVIGNDQVVVFDAAQVGSAGFFRLRARLQDP